MRFNDSYESTVYGNKQINRFIDTKIYIISIGFTISYPVIRAVNDGMNILGMP